jgi:predicted Zn finger-like uncharacterized protein
MPVTDSTRIIQCPKCAARFEVAASMAGKRARCAACETGFEIPGAEPLKQVDPSLPEFISVDCRVCGTRLTGRSEYIGKKIKCPDCGAGTVLPAPPPPTPKNMPAALEGEQYELWDPDDQPLPSELLARQPKYIAVVCRQCGTLMHANEIQVGQQVACPDCGMKQPVPIAPKPRARPPVLAADGDAPQIDPATLPGALPHIVRTSRGQTLAEQEAEAEYKRAVEKSRRTGRPMEIDERGRPILPRWPLVSGVLPILISTGVPAFWLGLSAGFMCAGWVLITGLQAAMSGGMGAIAGMCFFAIGCALMMFTASACSSLLMQIVIDSSTGNRQIQDWPSFLDWFGSLLYFIVGGMMSAIPGWTIAQIPPLSSSPGLGQLLPATSICLCLPIVFLSQLDNATPMGIVSGRVIASIGRCPFSWAFFYFECAVVIAICALATLLVTSGPGEVARVVTFRGNTINFAGSPFTLLWLTPLYVAAMIILARLLGRLGWRLAEAESTDEESKEDEEVRPRGPKNYNPPRPRKPAT